MPKWGGTTFKGTVLQNTCTIDNFLAVLVVAKFEVKDFVTKLSSHGHPAYKRALAALELLQRGRSAEAKVAWIGQINKRVIDAYGTEVAGFAHRLSEPCQTIQISQCSNDRCSRRIQEDIISLIDL